MTFSLERALHVARREYLAIVRRKAFLFTVLGTPAYFAFVMWMSVKPQINDRMESLRNLRVLGVVDSSGLYRHAERDIATDFSAEANPFSGKMVPTQVQWFQTRVRFFSDGKEADDSLRAGKISQLLIIPSDYLE